MAEEDNIENLDDLDWSDVENELKANKDKILSEASSTEKKETSNLNENNVSKNSKKSDNLDINFLLDVNLTIKVEVGRTEMLIEDLLRLEENSVVNLDSMVGQPLNIRANEKLVARGEIIVINEKFAVKITDIISPDDRFSAL